MRKLTVIALVILVATLGAQSAHAQSFFSFSGGYSYGGAAGECPSVWNDCPNRPTGYALGFGGVGKIFGFEQEYAWTSDFFGKGGDLEGSKVTTLMTNFLIGVPLGAFHPYGNVGIGAMKAKMEFRSNLADYSDTSFGWNYGAGVIIMLPAHLGFRFDYRHFASSAEIPIAGPVARVNNSFEFSRATFGLVLH